MSWELFFQLIGLIVITGLIVNAVGRDVIDHYFKERRRQP